MGDSIMTLTYWMNRLQRWMPMTAKPILVTLNPQTPPDPAKTYAKYDYSHPVYNPRAISSQKKVMDMQGNRNTYFCGAYLGFGFHEDGLTAGLLVAKKIGSYCSHLPCAPKGPYF
jgi:predicted NAD/FAD-binding protein